ncbi:MAG: GNAT family N-acetyltransferase [Thermomicrobiales bacterium]|nr:GNAT family N-acetyltransferase [Thermomicrobiales bacterium]
MSDSAPSSNKRPKVELAILSASVLQALVAGSIDRAGVLFGRQLPPSFLDHHGLWEYRLAQVEVDPTVINWLVRAVIDPETGDIVGHAGFHGPPDNAGMVEIGYTIEPEFRRRGYARATVAALIDYAASDPDVTTIRASVSPDNAASLATIRPFGFTHVGEQMDEIDGLELIFEVAITRS